jgi:leucyl aminopeptidase (aminopeptidase T)
VTLRVQEGYITSVTCEDRPIEQEVRDYLFSTPNGHRAGEFAIGTLTSLKQLTGNLLQDEKMPGLHVAFGNPYPEFTGADWDAKIHVDVIPSCCTIEIDDRQMMRDGQFLM